MHGRVAEFEAERHEETFARILGEKQIPCPIERVCDAKFQTAAVILSPYSESMVMTRVTTE